MPNRMHRRVRAILAYGPPEPWELYSGAFTLLWGLWFASPTTTTVVPLLEEAPAAALGLPIAAVGALKLYALFWRPLRFRQHVGITMTGLWCGLSIVYILANWRAQTTVVYPPVAICAGWTVLRIGHARRLLEARGEDAID